MPASDAPLVDALVVGAGLAGATAARSLADAGFSLTVLDKGRGPGGRLSSRRSGDAAFDHGASTLQVDGPEFAAFLASCVAAGAAAAWQPQPARSPLHVGTPGMNALVAHQLAGLLPRWNAVVAALGFVDGRWRAWDAEGVLMAEARQLVLAVPAPQARRLLAEGRHRGAEHPALAAIEDALAKARYAPCWAALVQVRPAFASYQASAVDLLHPDDGVLAMVVREAAKPGRIDAGHWTAHADAAWSEAHLEDDAETAAVTLQRAFLAATGFPLEALQSFSAHRWRYSRPDVGVDCSGLPELGLALAGDAVGWSTDAGLTPAGNAWRSGRAAAAQLRAAQPKS